MIHKLFIKLIFSFWLLRISRADPNCENYACNGTDYCCGLRVCCTSDESAKIYSSDYSDSIIWIIIGISVILGFTVCVFVCKCISIHERRKRIRHILNSTGFLLRQDSNYFNLENESNQNNERNNNSNNDNISNPPIYYVCVDNNAAAPIQNNNSQSDSQNFVDLKLVDELPTYEQAVKSNA